MGWCGHHNLNRHRFGCVCNDRYRLLLKAVWQRLQVLLGLFDRKKNRRARSQECRIIIYSVSRRVICLGKQVVHFHCLVCGAVIAGYEESWRASMRSLCAMTKLKLSETCQSQFHSRIRKYSSADMRMRNRQLGRVTRLVAAFLPRSHRDDHDCGESE